MDETISNRKPYSQKEYGFQQIYLGTVSKRKKEWLSMLIGIKSIRYR